MENLIVFRDVSGLKPRTQPLNIPYMKLTQFRFVQYTEDCFRSYNIRKLTNNFKLSSEYTNCHRNKVSNYFILLSPSESVYRN